MHRPDATEYDTSYAAYISLVPESDPIAAMESQLEGTLAVLRAIPREKWTHRYAPDKWSIAEVVGHMIDGERVFAGRALFFAREAAGAHPGMEQNDWIAVARYHAIDLSELIAEFEHLRRSDILFFRHLDHEAWPRRGKASGYEFTVRALAYILVGHERHHLGVLRTRYGV